ncbi:MAG: hypothetical protein L0216_17230 [Planctomycetales bacterium]|nr:hypothetical protein [Planctomycetales bacterium]
MGDADARARVEAAAARLVSAAPAREGERRPRGRPGEALQAALAAVPVRTPPPRRGPRTSAPVETAPETALGAPPILPLTWSPPTAGGAAQEASRPAPAPRPLSRPAPGRGRGGAPRKILSLSELGGFRAEDYLGTLFPRDAWDEASEPPPPARPIESPAFAPPPAEGLPEPRPRPLSTRAQAPPAPPPQPPPAPAPPPEHVTKIHAALSTLLDADGEKDTVAFAARPAARPAPPPPPPPAPVAAPAAAKNPATPAAKPQERPTSATLLVKPAPAPARPPSPPPAPATAPPRPGPSRPEPPPRPRGGTTIQIPEEEIPKKPPAGKPVPAAAALPKGAEDDTNEFERLLEARLRSGKPGVTAVVSRAMTGPMTGPATPAPAPKRPPSSAPTAPEAPKLFSPEAPASPGGAPPDAGLPEFVSKILESLDSMIEDPELLPETRSVRKADKRPTEAIVASEVEGAGRNERETGAFEEATGKKKGETDVRAKKETGEFEEGKKKPSSETDRRKISAEELDALNKLFEE